MLARHSTDCPPITWSRARDIQDGKAFGPVTLELHHQRYATLAQLYHWDPAFRRYGCLSDHAKRCLGGAARQLTGMDLGPNEYWLAEAMSEAIEAAEALGL